MLGVQNGDLFGVALTLSAQTAAELLDARAPLFDEVESLQRRQQTRRRLGGEAAAFDGFFDGEGFAEQAHNAFVVAREPELRAVAGEARVGDEVLVAQGLVGGEHLVGGRIAAVALDVDFTGTKVERRRGGIGDSAS